jgi:hypothetical protein
MDASRQAVATLCDTIRGATGLLDVTCDPSPGVTKETLPDLEEEYSVTISPEVSEFFTSVNGLRLAWRYEAPELAAANTYIEGRAKLLTFHEMMMGFDGRFWCDELWTESMPAAQLAFAKRLKVVDYFGTDYPRCVCLEIVDGVVTPRLWLNRQGQRVKPLELDLSGYLSALRETKAIWGWQYLYADLNLSRDESARATCEEIVAWYPRIFEDGFGAQLRERMRSRFR